MLNLIADCDAFCLELTIKFLKYDFSAECWQLSSVWKIEGSLLCDMWSHFFPLDIHILWPSFALQESKVYLTKISLSWMLLSNSKEVAVMFWLECLLKYFIWLLYCVEYKEMHSKRNSILCITSLWNVNWSLPLDMA